ncbi:MAG: EAL domain-containing protein [Candidatus Coproplasma sp.]
MKKSKIFHKINKSTGIKACLIAALIVIVEVVCGILSFNLYAQYSYEQSFVEYASEISKISDVIDAQTGVEDYDDESVISSVRNYLRNDNSFVGYVLFTEAGGGRIVGNGWALENNLTDYSIDYSKTQLVTLDGKIYVFTCHKIGQTTYYVGGLDDFTEQQKIIDGMLSNMVAYLVIAGILILSAFLVYVYWAGSRERYKKFEYRFTVSPDGKIIKSNAAFVKDFGKPEQIKADFSKFDRKSYNLLPLTAVDGERTLVLRLRRADKNYQVYASDVKNARDIVGVSLSGTELTSTGKAQASLSTAYESFVERGKRTLIGVIVITNLNQIGTLFGKEMALNIQKVVINKAQEKFNYVYELDLGRIGMAYPDGKNLDILLSEMEDNLQYLSQPIRIEDNLFTVELRSGFALCDSAMPSLDFDYAMRAANAALQRVTDTGVAEYVVYHESQKSIYAKYFIKFDIKQMLTEGAFEMEYQPQYNIKERRIEGFEALFRVKKSWNVNVDTFSFITYAERTGAMVQLGDFIFDTGMRFAKQLDGKNVSVSLNVSPVQLMQAGFIENFLRIYKKYELKPGSICVEITESFLMTNFNETLKKLEILKANGINTHLDDFGTEYSSLLYLKKLPISTIKIDKEFVHDIIKDKASQAIVKFITNIAKLLNCTTICEGVELPNEFDMLSALGCDTIQGWLIGKSMKPEEALKVIDTFDYDTAAAAKLASQAGKPKESRFNSK